MVLPLVFTLVLRANNLQALASAANDPGAFPLLANSDLSQPTVLWSVPLLKSDIHI